MLLCTKGHDQSINILYTAFKYQTLIIAESLCGSFQMQKYFSRVQVSISGLTPSSYSQASTRDSFAAMRLLKTFRRIRKNKNL